MKVMQKQGDKWPIFTCFSHTFHRHFTCIFHIDVKFCIVK